MSESWKNWEGHVAGGQFHLRRLLGATDRSAVFLTEAPAQESQIAGIKFIPADPDAGEIQLTRWRLAARLSHPHLARIFASGRCLLGPMSLLYVVMEHAEEDLSQIIPQRALTQAALWGILRPALSEVNMVNAPVVAKERGIKVSETRRPREGIYEGYIKITVTLAGGSARRVAGTVFSDGRPRLIQIKDINMESEFAPHMLYVVNEDKPGFIGKLGTLLGDAAVNIANFNLGRAAPGADAIALVEVDGPVADNVLAAIRKLPLVKMAKALAF